MEQCDRVAELSKNMTAHPEGGYYKRHFESDIEVQRVGEEE
jgi:predicted cupin superfamily sugar epimerase